MPDAVLRAERFVFSVEAVGIRRKVFQCQFARRDGSIFINFPYYRHTTGIVSQVSWPAKQPTATLSLEPGGKVTSHLVKYSHHTDGRAHFSQDSKVRTLVKKEAVQLDDIEGHFFTLHVQGISNFDEVARRDFGTPPNSRRHPVNFSFTRTAPDAVKFVARIHTTRWLKKHSAEGQLQPVAQLVGPDGNSVRGFICSTPLGNPGQDRCLVISCEAWPRLDVSCDSLLLFVGGFDSGANMDNPAQSVSFLAMSYPAKNFEDLRRRLGSIDFDSPSAA